MIDRRGFTGHTRPTTSAWPGGARHVTITTKHHDGFCLFDSKLTPFCIRATPFRRDVCREMADACRRAGLKQCWYHSIMDWHQIGELLTKTARPAGPASTGNPASR